MTTCECCRKMFTPHHPGSPTGIAGTPQRFCTRYCSDRYFTIERKAAVRYIRSIPEYQFIMAEALDYD